MISSLALKTILQPFLFFMPCFLLLLWSFFSIQFLLFEVQTILEIQTINLETSSDPVNRISFLALNVFDENVLFSPDLDPWDGLEFECIFLFVQIKPEMSVR